MFIVGDRIIHNEFGSGIVNNIKNNNGDKIITVIFFNDPYNTKYFTEVSLNENIKNRRWTVLNNSLYECITNQIDSTCEFTFDGFYHMTHFENALSIVNDRKIYSRQNAAIKVDMQNHLNVTQDVLTLTKENITNYVRFYFRPKTPTYWHFKNQNVVLFKMKKSLLLQPNAKISLGNAYSRSDVDLLTVNLENLTSIDFNLLYKSSSTPIGIEKNLRNTELLIPNEVSIEYVESIYFKDFQEKRNFINTYNFRNVKLIVNPNIFI